jgi:biotin carboxyl carrier protein
MSGPERTVMFQLPTVVSGQLVCVEGTVAGRSWDLSAGTFVIGRKDGCDLHLPAEPGVSKVHCKIVAEGTSYRLTDAESRNGTILNGMPTQSAILHDGDLIQVCGCKLRFSQTSDGNAQVRNPAPSSAELELTDPVQASPPYADPSELDLDLTLHDQAPPGAFDMAVTDATRPQAPAPATVEIRGSTLWSFFTGLFAMLICGGGAYAALLYVNDGQLPPPGGAVADPAGDGDDTPTDPGGDGDKVDPAGDGDTNDPTGDGDVAATDPAGDGEKVDPAGDGDDTATDPTAGDGDKASDEPDPEPEKVAATSTKKNDPGRRRNRRGRKKVEPATDPEPEAAKAPDPEPAAEPEAAEPEPEAAAAEPVTSEWMNVTYVAPPKKPVRVPSGGRVQSVDAADGDLVTKGQVLAKVESANSSAAEIATKKESIRALKSIVEASGDPEAQKLLTEEEAALKQMLASSKSSVVTAPIAGKLEGFRVKAGETLRSRLVVGFVRSQDEPVLEVIVSKAIASKIKPGQAVPLKMPGGTEEGIVKGKPQKRGKKYKVTIVAGGVELADVTQAQLP